MIFNGDMMERRRIIAELIDPGECRHYRRGQKFVLEGRVKPAGFCDGGYIAVSRAARMLLENNKMDSLKSDRVLAKCSRRHSHGAIWEVYLEDIAGSKRLDDEIDNILGEIS